MAQVYQKRIQIRFRDADPARILFFGNVFSLAHDTFEDFIQESGISWRNWFSGEPYIVPIRHAECDYLAPFRVGEHYEVKATVAQLRESSFQMRYVFTRGSQTHAVVTMVHTFLDPKTQQKIPIPETVKSKLLPFLESP
jgi:acyl-CoA thioester hydrolase/1,4-dihydroxy-2-naphthoyl-CoA hydrolase